MSFFRKLFGKHQDEAQQQTKQAEEKQTNTKEPETPEAKNDQPDSHMVIVTMLATANTALTKGEYSRAADTYKQILKLESKILLRNITLDNCIYEETVLNKISLKQQNYFGLPLSLETMDMHRTSLLSFIILALV